MQAVRDWLLLPRFVVLSLSDWSLLYPYRALRIVGCWTDRHQHQLVALCTYLKSERYLFNPKLPTMLKRPEDRHSQQTNTFKLSTFPSAIPLHHQ
ncbi:hypothetical protein K523DRAFT_73785 [Schizophyllum commune Tattone D]|nr:hypothetical protein K523DRAFT_73785 [Schizophyllum commune Tattone D]